jgi:hypothetical protein
VDLSSSSSSSFFLLLLSSFWHSEIQVLRMNGRVVRMRIQDRRTAYIIRLLDSVIYCTDRKSFAISHGTWRINIMSTGQRNVK